MENSRRLQLPRFVGFDSEPRESLQGMLLVFQDESPETGGEDASATTPSRASEGTSNLQLSTPAEPAFASATTPSRVGGGDLQPLIFNL